MFLKKFAVKKNKFFNLIQVEQQQYSGGKITVTVVVLINYLFYILKGQVRKKNPKQENQIYFLLSADCVIHNSTQFQGFVH